MARPKVRNPFELDREIATARLQSLNIGDTIDATIINAINYIVADNQYLYDRTNKKIQTDDMYPYNLLEAVFEGPAITKCCKEETILGVEYVLDQLPKRISELLYDRYREYKTLEEVGSEMNLTRERVRQIESKGLRIMRSPTFMTYLENGYSAGRRIEIEREMLKTDKKIMEEISNENEPKTATKPKDVADIQNMPIEDLEFSVRTYNCLKRTNINTVGEIAAFGHTSDDFLKIKSLGRGSYNEIVRKMTALGYEDYRMM